MSRSLLIVSYCALLLILHPYPAHAYLMPLIGLIGALGGVVGIVVTAVLSVVFLFFFHGKQLKRLLSRKKPADNAQPDGGENGSGGDGNGAD